MSGLPFPRSGAIGLLLAVMALVPSTGCADRTTTDDMEEPRPAHPPELLAERDEACEDYCDTRERCGGMSDSCSCGVSLFDDKHVLCVEKATAKLECLASTSCELLEQWVDLPPQDRPCYGEGVAESVACRPQ